MVQIPAENLPHALGGTCDCPNGGCSLSDAGPWNTPAGRELVEHIREEQKGKREQHEKAASAGAGAATVNGGQ